MELSSEAFEYDQEIPKKYTCQGLDVSPPLTFRDVPAGTVSLALVCEDPDAPLGTFTHWVLYNLPSGYTGLPENVQKTEETLGGAFQGRNGFGRVGYNGPCPPNGPFHRYFFRLYAVDSKIDLQPRLSKTTVLRRLEGHVVAQAELMGRSRKVGLGTFVKTLLRL